ncbi:hypothetical protein CC1G_05325 [Coprinopsis cinerea okayama7|uniref:CBS domain-containing protein n=1 Tax=Coprinopsis cinerea (strain Okayama-7 / 130 / ATCC MYA-4618 / FGSC 9003) TaxID=240176 RepID=A8PCN1_COPC7|nr:hypothetical protein CC1G_05325 [Coprinopsis cinerea okayama7\|eukprot:XP_001840439.1 hypothetical protein CC1G_05325 [Coprinopsis cinerea okayama7\
MATTVQLPPSALSSDSTCANPNCNADKYRGAVVEDLQLPPAFCLPASESISRAIEQAYERDFSHIPVLDRSRRPLGYIDVPRLKKKWEAGGASPCPSGYVSQLIPLPGCCSLSSCSMLSKSLGLHRSWVYFQTELPSNTISKRISRIQPSNPPTPPLIQTDKVSNYMTKFNRTSTGKPYALITPMSPLSDLEEFLKDNLFALVTDANRKFVLAVATSQDLENFVSRRGW